jgi:hypothetical protein
LEDGRCTGTYKTGAPLGKNNMGEWVDTVIFIDLMKARLQEACFSVLVKASDQKSKIPYTQAGVNLLALACRTLFDSWVRGGQIVYWKERHKPVSETTKEERASRKYDGLYFVAQLAGAINKIGINVLLED